MLVQSRLRRLRLFVVPLLLGVAAIFSGPVLAGPDVTVFNLSDIGHYGATGGVRGYSVGTTSCNIGDKPLNWCNSATGCPPLATPADHPVISQNMYRLKNGRLDQIGASWLKHGFVSLNNTASGCGNGTCVSPPFGGKQLGIGCTDPYGSSLNGSRPLGRKSEVNSSTGAFPFPPGGGGASSTTWNQRLAVAETDLSAASNPGARYFVEGQYIAPDDAVAGNGLNNASYREVTVNASFTLSMSGATVRERSAIEVWPLIDPTVTLMNVDIAGAPVERFHVARKVTSSGGVWHYEYAVHNLNSNRAADEFRVEFANPATITGVGFHDVDAHSNEPYDTADWVSSVSATGVQWAAPPFPTSPQNANALRWSTTYNFWFDSTLPPAQISSHVLGLFVDGAPAQVDFALPTGDLFQNGYE